MRTSVTCCSIHACGLGPSAFLDPKLSSQANSRCPDAWVWARRSVRSSPPFPAPPSCPLLPESPPSSPTTLLCADAAGLGLVLLPGGAPPPSRAPPTSAHGARLRVLTPQVTGDRCFPGGTYARYLNQPPLSLRTALLFRAPGPFLSRHMVLLSAGVILSCLFVFLCSEGKLSACPVPSTRQVLND